MNKKDFSDFPFNPAQLTRDYNPLMLLNVERMDVNSFRVKVQFGKGQHMEAEFTNVLQTLGNAYLEMQDPESKVILEIAFRLPPGPRMEEIFNKQIERL